MSPDPAHWRAVEPPAPSDLESIVSIAELSRRPSRPADHAAENRALVGLAQVMAVSPDAILHRLADAALDLCGADSAGLSLLEEADQKRNFHWRAIAGAWAPHLGGGTPRDFGPCGTVLDRNASQVFSHPERDFPYFAEVTPYVEDGLLIPFYVGGEAIGTIWVIAHTEGRRFDTEDLRVMTNLATFAGAAYQTLLSLNLTIKGNQELVEAAIAMQLFSSIVQSAGDAIVTKDLDGVITSWNSGAERIFRYTAAEAIGQNISMLIPFGQDDEERSIIERIRRGERIHQFETKRRRKDGSLVDISLTVSPVKNARGVIVGASKVARDITERRLAQEQQILLLREMGHRINNLFAVTSGLVALSARSARSPQEMAAAVQARLAALTRAHELTRPGLINPGGTPSRNTTLQALIRTILAPYVDTRSSQEDGSTTVSGIDAPIGPSAITNIALVLHELATNAAKYGALSSAEGGVHIECSLENNEVRVKWRERRATARRRAADRRVWQHSHAPDRHAAVRRPFHPRLETGGPGGPALRSPGPAQSVSVAVFLYGVDVALWARMVSVRERCRDG